MFKKFLAIAIIFTASGYVDASCCPDDSNQDMAAGEFSGCDFDVLGISLDTGDIGDMGLMNSTLSTADIFSANMYR